MVDVWQSWELPPTPPPLLLANLILVWIKQTDLKAESSFFFFVTLWKLLTQVPFHLFIHLLSVSSPQGGDYPERRGDRSCDRGQNHERRRGRPQWWDEALLTRWHQKVLKIIIWAQNQNEILCLSEMLIRNFLLKITFLSWTPVQTGRQVRRLYCVTPWTVRDQILEISAARLHILRLPTWVASDCLPWRCYWLDANGKFFFSTDPCLLKILLVLCYELQFFFSTSAYFQQTCFVGVLRLSFQGWCMLGTSYERSMETW